MLYRAKTSAIKSDWFCFVLFFLILFISKETLSHIIAYHLHIIASNSFVSVLKKALKIINKLLATITRLVTLWLQMSQTSLSLSLWEVRKSLFDVKEQSHGLKLRRAVPLLPACEASAGLVMCSLIFA